MSGHSKWSTIKRQKGRPTQSADNSSPKLAEKSRSRPGKDSLILMQTHGCDWRLTGRAATCRRTTSNERFSVPLARASADQYRRDLLRRVRSRRRRLDDSGADRQPQSNRRRGEGSTHAGRRYARRERQRRLDVRSYGPDRSAGRECRVDDVALVAIDAGASDVETEDGVVMVYTEPTELHRVREALTGAGHTRRMLAQLTMRPKDARRARGGAGSQDDSTGRKTRGPGRRARGLHEHRRQRRGSGRGALARRGA